MIYTVNLISENLTGIIFSTDFVDKREALNFKNRQEAIGKQTKLIEYNK